MTRKKSVKKPAAEAKKPGKTGKEWPGGRGRNAVFTRPATLLVKLDQADLDRIRAAAQAAGLSVSEWVRAVLLRECG